MGKIIDEYVYRVYIESDNTEVIRNVIKCIVDDPKKVKVCRIGKFNRKRI